MAVCVESYRAWLSTEARTDDITVIVIDFELGRGLRCGAAPRLHLTTHAVALHAALCWWHCQHPPFHVNQLVCIPDGAE
jgi:hypothetical protein